MPELLYIAGLRITPGQTNNSDIILLWPPGWLLNRLRNRSRLRLLDRYWYPALLFIGTWQGRSDIQELKQARLMRLYKIAAKALEVLILKKDGFGQCSKDLL